MHAQTRTSAHNAQAHMPKGSARPVMTSAHQHALHLLTPLDSNGPPEPSLHLEAGPQSPPSRPSLDLTAGSQPRTAGPSCALHTSRSLVPTMMILALPSLTPMTETLTLTPTLGGFQPILRQDTERDPQACRNEKNCISPTQWVESRNMEQMPQKPYTNTDLPQTCPDSPQPDPFPHHAPGPRTPSCSGLPRSFPQTLNHSFSL